MGGSLMHSNIHDGGFNMYFAYDPNGDGFMTFNTESEARKYAHAILQMEREYAYDEGEWSEDVDGVCWGKIIENAKSFGPYYGEDDEEYRLYLDYELASV